MSEEELKRIQEEIDKLLKIVNDVEYVNGTVYDEEDEDIIIAEE